MWNFAGNMPSLVSVVVGPHRILIARRVPAKWSFWWGEIPRQSSRTITDLANATLRHGIGGNRRTETIHAFD